MEEMGTGFPILHVDDEEDNLETFDMNFGDRFELAAADGGEKALEMMAERKFSVLVVDQRMPGMTGLEFLEKAREIQPEAIAILLTAYRDIEVVVEALNSGLVHRYVQKPWDRREMVVVLDQALELFGVKDENRRLVARLEELNRYLGKEVDWQYNYGDIVGDSPKLQEVLDTVEKVAPTQSTVLITGESGTGKELVARAIHNSSPQRDGPFVRVNLAALPPTVIESELFGHEKGAFTGAISQRLGRFELAHNGSLFLDEIGDLPPEIQIRLLRVLQEKEFERVGGAETVRVDVRIIAATNRNLDELVQQGAFREDLYYRVNVFPIPMPPLRERKEDVPPLANHFLKKFESRVGKSISELTPEALGVLLGYDWPGNVRELENVMERAMILAAGPRLEGPDLAFLGPAAVPEEQQQGGLPEMLENLEKHQLKEALDRNEGSVSRTAAELGINRTTLYYRLKKYGLIS